MAQNAEKSFWALIITSLVAAFLASTCCLAPLLFLLFGISATSLSFLKIFVPYHIYFVLAAFILILYLWYRYFKLKSTRTYCSKNLCRYHLHYLIFGTLLIGILLTYQYWILYFIGD